MKPSVFSLFFGNEIKLHVIKLRSAIKRTHVIDTLAQLHLINSKQLVHIQQRNRGNQPAIHKQFSIKLNSIDCNLSPIRARHFICIGKCPFILSMSEFHRSKNRKKHSRENECRNQTMRCLGFGNSHLQISFRCAVLE